MPSNADVYRAFELVFASEEGVGVPSMEASPVRAGPASSFWETYDKLDVEARS